jgi:hypothetical protein
MDPYFGNPKCSSLHYSEVCYGVCQIMIRCEGISCYLVVGTQGVPLQAGVADPDPGFFAGSKIFQTQNI